MAVLVGVGWKMSGCMTKKTEIAEPLMPADNMPYLFQTDDQWGNETYGDGLFKETGCGPTFLAMVLTPFLGWQPDPAEIARYAQDNGHYGEGIGTVWTLFTEYPSQFGIRCWQSELDEDYLQEQLDSGNLLRFSMGPGDFTTSGHIIADGGSDEPGFVNVHDPNSKERGLSTKLCK